MKLKTILARILQFIYSLFGLCTAMVGYEIHQNVFFSIINFILWPISLGFWFVTHEINVTIIKETFNFFFK